MANEIKTRISLDIADGMAKLKSFGDTGEAALKGIDAAAKGATQSIQTMGAAINTAITRSTISFEQMTKGIAAANVPRPPRQPPPLPGQPEPRVPRSGGDGGGLLGEFNSLRDAFRALGPALNAAGIAMSGLTPIMYATQGGATALAAAIGGGLLVAFEKAADAANDVSARLGSFLGGPTAGKAAFAGLQELGKTLGTSATALAKPFEELIRIGQGLPGGPSQQNLLGILGSLDKSMQAERISEDARTKTLTSFLESVRKEKGITAAAFESLKTAAPDTAAAIAKAIQKEAPGQLEAGFVPARTVTAALERPEFVADAAARKAESAAQAADSISTAFDHLAAATENLARAAGGGTNIIANAINAVANFFNRTADLINGLPPAAQAVASSAASGAAKGAAIGGGLAGAPGAAVGAGVGLAAGVAGAISEFFAPKIPKELEGFGAALDGFIASLQDGTAATKDFSTAIKAAEDFAKIPKQLAAHAATLSREQAAVNLQFLPQEQELQLRRDKLNIEKAEIAIQSAQIGKVEAQKQLELAALAPAQAQIKLTEARKQQELAALAPLQAAIGVAEARKQQELAALAKPQAELATENARLNLESLKVQKRRKQGEIISQSEVDELEEKGLDTKLKGAEIALQTAQINEKYASLEPRKAELAGRLAEIQLKYAPAEIAKAEIAGKVAEVEAKYAYLAVPKAELAARQAEIAIKSADIEKADATLKLAKDEAGQPIDRDLAALRYAQASLDEFQKLNEIAGEQLQTLGEILEAINALAPSKSGKAGGGLIRGPGSATSDSIPTLLSDGEFVVAAAATNFYGTNFLHALNGMRLPRFSAGGLVGLFSPQLPRFADGGLIAANGAITSHLGTVDLRTDHGSVTMMATSHAATQLQRLAVTKRMTSTGRKPGFIG